MSKKFLKLIKFRENRSGAKTPSEASKKLKGYATAPRRFAKIFTRTAFYLRKMGAIEKKSGVILQSELHELILTWAKELLGIIRVDVTIQGEVPEQNIPVLFVGNHVGYVDIPLLMASVPVVFVSKAEISKWLVIGPASRRAGTVFVKRESLSSRARTAQAIAECILERKQSLAIFPAGTTSIDETTKWRPGAFKIAQRYKFAVQPFRLTYEPLRKVAFVDQDILPTHLFNLLSHGDRVKAVLEFGELQYITDPVKDCDRLWKWAQQAHPETKVAPKPKKRLGWRKKEA